PPALAQGTGTWTNVGTNWLAFPIHMMQLPDGKLLIMNRYRPQNGSVPSVAFEPYLISGSSYTTFTSADVDGSELFCAGHVPLQDGTILVTGGHDMDDGYGRVDQWIFNPASSTWIQQSDMGYARWYPTSVFLPNQRVYTFSGEIVPNTFAKRFTMWLGNVFPATDPSDISFTVPSSMEHDLDGYYPHIFIDPYDGNLIAFGKGLGPTDDAGRPYYGNDKLNLATLAWTNDYLPLSNVVTQNVRSQYPSAVMINGRVVRTGGSKPNNTSVSDCSRRTQWIDLNGDRTWNVGPDMVEERKNHTLVALADGRVAAFGGNQTGLIGNADDCRAPEVWDPSNPSGAWTLWAGPTGSGNLINRGYHSTALLLPDATVMVGGGEGEDEGYSNSVWPKRKAQIFTPPYGGSDSWQSDRPTIDTSAPGPLRYGDTFSLDVGTSGSRQVKKLILISLGATTHAFNQRQNVVFLTTTSGLPQNEGTLTVNAPSAAKHAPPGYYMLFAVDSEDVPSIAKIVLLKDYEMVFPSVSLTSGDGTFSTSLAPSEQILGDNEYMGTSITAGGSGSSYAIEMIAEHSIISSLYGTRNLRLTVQLKGSTHPITASVSLYNWTTSTYDSIDSDLVGTNELDHVYTTSNNTQSQNPYVRSSDGKVKWRYRLTKSSAFTAYVDILETGVRS
ncbi:MAG TPA: galactose oxidase early set domain-containing protein, partial [Fimbriimonadaceae bacterium]|nr:galactose oxidase early set domain-containing protein [Fimbriimonadaceae bacterium]